MPSQQPFFRVLPSDQCFGDQDFVLGGIHYGLKVHDKLVIFQAMPKF